MSSNDLRNSAPYRLTRLAISAGLALAGFFIARFLLDRGILVGPNNLLYLTALGALVGYLISARAAAWTAEAFDRFHREWRELEPEAVLAAGTGATVALLVAVLVNNVLAPVPGFTWFWSLLVAVILVLAISWFFVANRHLFPFIRGDSAELAVDHVGPRPKIIDTSAIIDGRIVDVIEANFLEGRILVPRFVLGELQHIADSEDPLRRKRGRRGLEMLDRLIQSSEVVTEVLGEVPEEGTEVDEKLILLCQQLDADMITTDYNLNRVASLQGVRVLNLNQLANAVKAMFLPGERLDLHVVREGREAGQGLAYLEDGTMVVVEDAGDLVGATVEAVVTSSLQTNMGRMIFARPVDAD